MNTLLSSQSAEKYIHEEGLFGPLEAYRVKAIYKLYRQFIDSEQPRTSCSEPISAGSHGPVSEGAGLFISEG